MSKSFDLASYRTSKLETATVEILDPVTGEATGIKITVASPDSAQYRQVSLKVQNEQLQYAMKNKGKTTAERLVNNALEVLVGATVAWEGITEGGKELPCTPENVRKVYEEVGFIKDQVDEFVGDVRNFFKN